MLNTCCASPTGGNQVDGLPPALHTKYSLKDTRVCTDLFVNLRRFFEKSWIFMAETYIFEILPGSSMLMQKRMQEDLLLYRLLDEV